MGYDSNVLDQKKKKKEKNNFKVAAFITMVGLNRVLESKGQFEQLEVVLAVCLVWTETYTQMTCLVNKIKMPEILWHNGEGGMHVAIKHLTCG